jgi:hemoglobin
MIGSSGIRRTLSLLIAASALAACASTGDQMAASSASPTLYKRLGGREGIYQVVTSFVGNVVADDRIKARFARLKPEQVELLKSNLSDQICDATGGPCSYGGKDMKTTHKGMDITEAEWNATVEALSKALTKHAVPAKEQGELLAILGPMKKDIVGQ